MSSTPRGERMFITLLGVRNSGKSSLINALTGQEIAIVSETPGTTTDPVDKRYELIPIGPVTFYDTGGIDDIGELGEKRVQATNKILYRTDLALFLNPNEAFDAIELRLIQRLREMKIPLLVVFNKCDLRSPLQTNIDYCDRLQIPWCDISALSGEGVDKCKKLIVAMAPSHLNQQKILLGDIINAGDHVILVTPIDLSAPKGRLILPQVQVLRDLLDQNAIVTVVQVPELKAAIEIARHRPKLAVTDSQAIATVAVTVPPEVGLTTFSILFARYKGELNALYQGANHLDQLQDGDRILIAEACSHHVESDDIGRYKLPEWIRNYTGKDLVFEVYSGHDFPEKLEDYALIIHCGGCMINAMEFNQRIQEAERRSVPITNYGLTICKVHGVLERAVAPVRHSIRRD